MPRPKTYDKDLKIQLNQFEYNFLKQYAKSHNLSMAEVIRQLLRNLMNNTHTPTNT